MERILEVEPAYDKRDPDPEKNYGIHGVTIRMVLKGPHGATQFVIYTNRHLLHVQKEMLGRIHKELQLSENDSKKIEEYSGDFTPGMELKELVEWVRFVNKLELKENDSLLRPMAADLGYHSPVPVYEGHEPMRDIVKKMEFDPETKKMELPVYGDAIFCKYTGGDCYYDGTSMGAIRVFDLLFSSGEEAAWGALEQFYNANLVPNAEGKE